MKNVCPLPNRASTMSRGYMECGRFYKCRLTYLPLCKSNGENVLNQNTKGRNLINAGSTQMPQATTVLSVISHSILGAEKQPEVGLIQEQGWGGRGCFYWHFEWDNLVGGAGERLSCALKNVWQPPWPLTHSIPVAPTSPVMTTMSGPTSPWLTSA